MDASKSSSFLSDLLKVASQNEPNPQFYFFVPTEEPAIWAPLAESLADAVDIYEISENEAFADELLVRFNQNEPSHHFVFPPWVPWQKLPDATKKKFPRMSYPQIVINQALEALPPNSKLTVCAPAGVLSAGASRAFLATVLHDNAPTMVVTLSNSVGPLLAPVHHAFQFCLLTIEVAAKNLPLKFFKPRREVAFDKTVEDFKKLLRIPGGKTDLGFVLRDGLPADSLLIHDLYDPTFLHGQKTLEVVGELCRIDELFDFVPTINLTCVGNQLVSRTEENAANVVEGRAVQLDGTIDADDIKQYVSNPGQYALRAGDFCFRQVGHFGKGDLVFARIEDKHLPAVGSQSTVVLRPKEHLDRADVEVLHAMLSSDRFADAVTARSGNSIHLNRNWFGEIRIPLPDSDLKIAVRDINNSIEKFGHWKKDAIRRRNILFEFNSLAVMREEVLNSGRMSRLRVSAAESVDDLSYRIRTQYPHPVANRWRTVEMGQEGLESYVELLESAEVLAFYLACMAMVQAESMPDTELAYMTQICSRLKKGGENSLGTSMGDWLAIIREVSSSKKWRSKASDTFFPEIVTFIEKNPEADKALQRVSKARNDQSHGRGPKGKQVSIDFAKVYPDVEYLHGATEFISEYPLRLIEETKRDSMRKITRYRYRDLMGDHLLTPLRNGESDDAELEAGSLYLADRTGCLHRVRPFITKRGCPECGRQSLMYLDRFDANTNNCILKGLDHSHTVADAAITNDFRYVGLLPKIEA